MTTTDLDADALAGRPKSLSASSLAQRALLGLLILTFGIVASAWLYDASLRANATTGDGGAAIEVAAPAPTAPQR